MKNKRKAAVFAAALLLAAGLSACALKPAETSSSSLPEDLSLFPEGTSIGGKNISGKTPEEAAQIAKKAIEEEMDALEITVKFKDDTVLLNKGDFVFQELLDLNMPKLLENRKAQQYELSYVIDLSQQGKQKLWEAAERCFSEGKNATVKSFDGASGSFTFTDPQKGERVDMDKTMKSVRQLLSQKHGGAIQAAFSQTNPRLTKEYLKKNFKLLSTYSTESTNTENGNSNMRLALSHVNGTVLEPGQVFSYNGTIGDSTDPGAGWLPAGGLSGGISVQMYGGGICQGSTTIYNAVLLAGMEIVERDCHSMPSSYCPIGLDATVDYGNIDFKFRNPTDTPVYLSSWMEGVTLYVSVYGCPSREWDKIEVSSEQTGSEPPLSEVSFVKDADLAKGQYVRRSTGNTGYSARAYRMFYLGGKLVKTEELPSSYYAPTGTVYAVGEGTDTSKVDTGKPSGTTEPSPSPKPKPTPTKEPTPPPVETPTPPPTEPPVTEPPVTEPPVTEPPAPSLEPTPPPVPEPES